MSENSGHMTITISQNPKRGLKFLVLSDQPQKTRRYSVYNDINPQILTLEELETANVLA